MANNLTPNIIDVPFDVRERINEKVLRWNDIHYSMVMNIAVDHETD